MEAPLNCLKAYVAFVVIFTAVFYTSCGDKDELDPKPTGPVYVKPVVKINPATSVKITTATIEAEVVPNEDGTSISFEYKTSAEINWLSNKLPTTFSGKNNLKVTCDLSGLQPNTEYNFRVKASNKGGEAVSGDEKFFTYSVSDFDGNLYHTVVIGTQTWLKENFKGTHYANGDPIPNVTDSAAWRKLTTGAYCWYNNDAELGKVYGGLYNWYVASDPRGLITGWHTPVGNEWGTLNNYLGGYYPAGPALMSISSWSNPSRPGTNSSGFSAIANGLYNFDGASGKFKFVSINEKAVFWASSLFGGGANSAQISRENSWFSIGYMYPLNHGMAIRLVKN